MTLAAPLIGFSRRIGRFEFPIEQGAAFADAARNFQANQSALEAVWPRTILAIPESLPELEWLYARDGALSGRHIDGQWIGGVSVPARAAQKMFAKAAVVGSSAVLIAPTHAQQIRAVLERVAKQQVLIVIIPGEHIAGTILACEDFSLDIRAQRLWLACGPEWPEELNAILETQDGIAPASTMIRVPGLNADTVERVIKPCEAILSRNAQTHRSHLNSIHNKPRTPARPPRKICVVTGAFRLWDDAPALLARAAARANVTAVILDSSIPTQNSALKFARTADGCDAIVTANVARADLPLVVPDCIPWITWLTGTRIPRCERSASSDRLIVADTNLQRAATESGWPDSSVLVGQEPIRWGTTAKKAAPSIIADLPRIVVPRSVEEMSSQKLVWDRIENEVMRNPLCIGASPTEFMLHIAEEIGLERSALPLELFRTELLVPCFMRSLAKLLRDRGVVFSIFGRGWDSESILADRWVGPVEDETTLKRALESTSLMLDVWPGDTSNPARRAGKPMFRPWGRDLPSMLREITRAGIATTRQPDPQAIDLERVFATIR